MPSSYDLLATTTGSGVTSINLSGASTISQYKYLEIVGTAFFSTSGSPQAVKIQFNNDTGANYSWYYLEHRGGTGTGQGGMAGDSASFCVYRPNGTAALPLNFRSRLYNVNSTTQYKQASNRFGGATESYQGMYNCTWFNSANAITSIQLVSAFGDTMQAGTNFQLYGIKG
jgi:hypothetical protein